MTDPPKKEKKKAYNSKKTSDLKETLKEIDASAFKNKQALRVVRGAPAKRRKRLIGLSGLGSRPSLPNAKTSL
tara:strand:+ start:2672 stop:2890 length:219 start_codon:yes stop_codon:yes gene_type:complete